MLNVGCRSVQSALVGSDLVYHEIPLVSELTGRIAIKREERQ